MLEFQNFLLPDRKPTFDQLVLGDLFVVESNPDTLFIKTAYNKALGYEICRNMGSMFSLFVLDDNAELLNTKTPIRKVKFVGKLSYI